MAGFLRKKATLSRKVPVRDAKRERLSSDVAPSLPPLILSTSFADPDLDPRAPALPPAASPPVMTSTPAPEYLLDDTWDPWRAYADTTSAPRSHDGIPSSNAPVAVRHATPRPNPVATASSPREMSTRQAAHPKSDALDNLPLSQRRPASRPSTSSGVVRQTVVSNFDFEESLSAANVTSVVNQFRSYPPPIRHTSPASPSNESQMAMQQPPSSDAHRHHIAPQKPGSSSTTHTDPTRRTNGSHDSTSASSASEVIDVRTGPDGRLDPGRNGSIDRNIASSSSRPFTSPGITRALRSPPTSYAERGQRLARQTSLSSLSSTGQARPPMLFDILRSGNAESGPLRRGPLIFAAMSAAQQPSAKNPTATRNVNVQNPYPSPPHEYTPLDASSPPRRNGSFSPVFRGAPQLELRSHDFVISPILLPTELPPLSHKSSKSSLVRVAVERTSPAHGRADAGSDHARPRVLTKARPSTPQKPGTYPCNKMLPEPGDPLLLDDDPFARVQGVKMLKPRTRSSSGDGVRSCSVSTRTSREDILSSEDGHVKIQNTRLVPKAPLTPESYDDAPMPPGTPPPSAPENPPPTPPDDYKTARQQRRGQWLEKVPPPAVAEVVAKQLSMDEVEEQAREPTPPTYFPIMALLSDANLFPLLLSYLSYSEWLALYSANKQVRDLFQSRVLRESVLERYLSTVGYSKWDYEWAEPLALSLKDLHNYLRGVAMPTHQYARLSAAYLHPPTANRDAPTTFDTPDILALALTTRAYTRVVLRLRAQADSEARYLKMQWSAQLSQNTSTSRPGTRQHSVSSRAPSPTSSSSADSRNHSHGKNDRSPSTLSPGVSKFRSPLYRPGRAPVLRVFVPSPEGDWLSDASVVECEAELKRSSVLKLLRVGDIVWDVAVGDEGNLGRLMWDGSYLVDLDYRYSRMGELSPYFHSLAFSPSYFHRVVRIGGSASHNPHCNPIVYIDVSPWGREIAANLQLLQDRARTETPHGALHDVVRWVHRSTFTIRPPPLPFQGQAQSLSRAVRFPIPNAEGFYIDPSWYGTVVIESEGTNEGLADLQARCGPGVFPPRAESLATKIRNEKEKENRRVWRILREKSRPGEIWLRAVQAKERLM